MTRKIEVLVDVKDLLNGWSEIYAGADGQPRYRSNNQIVGTGTRITRVSDAPDPPPAPQPDPLPGAASALEFKVTNGIIEAINGRLIPYPYPVAGLFPRMYDMVIGGTTYTFDPATEASFVFTVGIYTVTFGYWGFVQVTYDSADAAQLPANGQTVVLMTVSQHRWATEDGLVISRPKPSITLSITGNTLQIDTTAPTIVSVSPSGLNVPRGTPITITCSEPVQAGTGNFVIRNTGTNTVHETIPASAATFIGNQITIVPSVLQDYSNSFSLRPSAGAFKDQSGNNSAAITADTYAWTIEDSPISGGLWYDEVFATRNGIGVGPRVPSYTPAATWAAGQSGVSNNGATITVTGGGKVVPAVDFSGFKLVNSGSNNIFRDCIGDVNANGAGGNGRQWDIGGLNPIVEYCRITNPSRRGGIVEIAFNDATGVATERYNDLRDWAGQDPVKGPGAGNYLNAYGSLLKGVHLTTGAHIDTYDFRLSEPGSFIRRALVIGDKTSTSVTPGGGTGYNNGVRQAPADFSGAGGNGLIVEECVFVGHDDPGANSYFFSIGASGKTGNVFFDVLIDQRFHPNLLHPSARIDDWYVRRFDYAASVAAGQITGITAPVAYPNLASHPATAPSTMAAPTIVAAPGAIQWLDNARPANQRSLITSYDLRYSTDGVNWTTVQGVSLSAGNLPVAAGSNYRLQFRAVNGIGPGAWSASSNLVNVAAPTGTHRIITIYGQSEPESILGTELAGSPAKPTLTADNKVRFVYHNPNAADPRPMVAKWLVASDTSLTGAMIAFANALIAIGGALDTWEIGWITYTGKGWSTLFNDGSTQFPFAHVQQVKAALSGVPVIEYQSWLSANRTFDTAYARGFENLWLGKDNGTPISAPWNLKNKFGANTAAVSHLLTEEFDPAVSIAVLGQHKFDVRQDNDSWGTVAGGGPDNTNLNIHGCRVGIEAFFAGANVGPSKRGADLCSYLNGYANGTAWNDIPHPGKKDVDGLHRFAKQLAWAVCEHLGLVNPQPRITSVTWTDQKVTISSSDGPITNVFAVRSQAQLNPATFPHYTQAMGFYINGLPAQRAELVGGNIELYYGDGTQKFINTDTIMFLPGGACASLKYPEDMQNGVWKGVPCVNIGVPGDGLMNLRPLIGFNAAFPNTLSNTTR